MSSREFGDGAWQAHFCPTLAFDYNNPLITPSDAKTIFGAFVEHGIAMIAAAQATGVVRAGPATMIMSVVRGSIRNTLKRRRMAETNLNAADRAACFAQATQRSDAKTTTRSLC